MAGAISHAELENQLQHIHQDRGLPVVVVTAVLGFIALVTLIARLVQRGKQGKGSFTLKRYGFDDYLMLAGSIFALGECLAIFLSYHYGVGKHFIAFKPQNLTPWGKMNLLLGFCYAAGMMLVKWSILILIWRIFAERSRYIRIGVYTLLTYTFLWCLAVCLVVGLACKPFSSNWSAPFCTPSKTPTIWTAAFNCAGDFMVVLLPQPLIWRLKMSVQRRFALSLLMALGLFASVCGIIRIVLSNELDPSDPTYGSADVALFFAVELLVTIICGNLPTIHQPVLRGWTSASGYVSSVASKSRSWLSRVSSRESFSESPSQSPRHGSYDGARQHSHPSQAQGSAEKGPSGVGEITRTVTIEVERA